MALSRRLRFEILKRDNHTCRYCGASTEDGAKLTVDHVLPQALGGGDTPDNLVAACFACNAGKASSSPDDTIVEDVRLDALRWARAIKEASKDRKRYRRKVTSAQKLIVDLWVYDYMPERWRASIEQFVQLGLDKEDLSFFMTKAIDRTRTADHAWRYFCKVSWSEITVMQQAATDAMTVPVVEEDEPESVEVEPVEWSPTPREDWEEIIAEQWCIECDDRPADHASPYPDGMCGPCRSHHYGVG